MPARAGLLERICTSARDAAEQALQQHLDPAAALLGAEQAGRHDAGVVEDQQIAGSQQARQVDHLAVAEIRPSVRRGAEAGRHCAAAADGGQSARREGRNGSRCAAWGAHASRGPGGDGPSGSNRPCQEVVRSGAAGAGVAFGGTGGTGRQRHAGRNESAALHGRCRHLHFERRALALAQHVDLYFLLRARTSPGCGRRGADSPVCGRRSKGSRRLLPAAFPAWPARARPAIPCRYRSTGRASGSSARARAIRTLAVARGIPRSQAAPRRRAGARATGAPSAAPPHRSSPTRSAACRHAGSRASRPGPAWRCAGSRRVAGSGAISPLRRSGLPSIATSTSPLRSPAACAGPDGLTPMISTPSSRVCSPPMFTPSIAPRGPPWNELHDVALLVTVQLARQVGNVARRIVQTHAGRIELLFERGAILGVHCRRRRRRCGKHDQRGGDQQRQQCQRRQRRAVAWSQ